MAGFSAALDEAARTADVVAITGASSTPAVTNAALDALAGEWSRVDAISVFLSPGNRAPRGLSVIKAILSYTGRPLRVFLDGCWTRAPGWGLTRRRLFPGVGGRWVSLCDTPDLDILPQRFQVRRSVLFFAGLELPVLHIGLVIASLAVRAGLLHSLEPLAGAVRTAARPFERFGTDRGGMLVEVAGRDSCGRDVRADWCLIAEGGDGPSIPILPALAVLRGLAEGRITQPGARACVGVLSLHEIEREFAPYRIAVERTLVARAVPLFQLVLREAFDRLPLPVRDLHRPGAWQVWSGRANIVAANTVWGRVAARVFGFPRSTGHSPVRVTMASDNAEETWTRNFGAHVFRSRLAPGNRLGTFQERFGLLTFHLTVHATANGITMRVTGWQIGPMKLPRVLAPSSTAKESIDTQGRFRFDVTMDLPLGLGRIVRYTGYLQPHDR